MGKTISVSAGAVAMKHDRRDYEQGKFPENVNEAMSEQNVYFKICENEREAFNSFFEESVNEYNERQTRADRKKGDYYSEIQKSKNGETPIYEYVFQIGNRGDTPSNSEDGLVCKSILTEYANGFEKENPNFHVISSCLHMDEDTPHLHVAFIPWADGYKKGLETRCSTSKALESMGFSGEERNMKFWKRSQEEKIEELMKEREIDREQFGSTRGRLSVQLYKEVLDKAKEQVDEELEATTQLVYETADMVESLRSEAFYLEQRNEELRATVNSLEARKNALNGEIKLLEGIVARFKAEFERIGKWLEENAPSFQKAVGSLVERMQKHMESVKYTDGTSVYDNFKVKELTFAERMEDAKKESENWKHTMKDFESAINRGARGSRGQSPANNSLGSRTNDHSNSNDENDRF